MNLKKYAIGIDLGTTQSCVAVVIDGKVKIIYNDNGNRTTPSCVAFTDAQLLVGDNAKYQMASNPQNSIFDTKRLIGRKFKDKIVQDDMKNWPFKVIAGGNEQTSIEVMFKEHTKTFTPEEISSFILSNLKNIAEKFLGQQVTDAVITVPAYFNNSQRQATKDAGAIAGLNVLRIINEPTAAALAYGIQHNKNNDEKTILIFDIGGGTTDVSIMKINGGNFDVLVTTGDTHLGGEDFDNRMVTHFVKEFKAKYNKDILSSPRALRRLKTACEVAKKNLSFSVQTPIEIESFFDGIDLISWITRSTFEELCDDLFTKCMKSVNEALTNLKANIKMNKNNIDEIILVGGSSRVPKLQELLSEIFCGKKLNHSLNPDEAVAYGAAIQAAILSADKRQIIKNVKLSDVVPLSLGVSIKEDNTMSVIIKKNTKIPTSITERYTTFYDNQASATFKVYEGEDPSAEKNNLLGKFILHGISPAPKGVPQFDVTFKIDKNSILFCSGVELKSGIKDHVVITNCTSRFSDKKIKKLIKDNRKYKTEDNAIREKIEAMNDLNSYCFEMEKTLIKNKSSLPYQIVLNRVLETRQWLPHFQQIEIQQIITRKKELVVSINNVMKLHNTK